jgi:hypothetical protein
MVSQKERSQAVIAEAIKFILANYSLSFLVLGLMCAGLSFYQQRKTATKATAFEALLSFYCLCSIGLNYIYNFVVHVFFAQTAAAFIGWENSPFQYEVGFASLGFGVVGLLAFRRDFGLRLAAVTGPAFFLWGAAGGHLYQMVVNHNFSPGNAGVIFWTDLFLPVLGFFFLFAWRKTNA